MQMGEDISVNLSFIRESEMAQGQGLNSWKRR